MALWYSKSITKKTCGEGEKSSAGTVGTWRQAAAVATASMSSRKSSGKFVNVGGFKFEKQWQEKILSHGSARDKILLKFKLILSNPVLHCRHLDTLVPMVTPAKKRDCATAIDTLRKLFIQLLPKSRSLISFDQRPFHILDVTKDNVNLKEKKKKKGGGSVVDPTVKRDQTLAFWLFEDNLKRKYEEFLSNMEVVVLRDVLEQNKKKALGTMFELLQNKPEQRSRLVRILANKVGDPSGKLASHAKHKLLLAAHKKLSLVPAFVSEFERMLYRPNIREKAQYFVICCLNSMQLRRKAGKSYDKVPLTLIKIYCSFFRAALDKKKIVKRKMLGALLSGIHRAFPFLKREEVNEHLQQHINDIFRLVHTTHTFNQSVQALMVLFHFNKYHEDMHDRFYQVLYRKLGDWRLIRRSSQRQSLLLHLVFRALSDDDDLPRLKAFTKRLLTLCLHSADIPLICGLLLVLSELQKTHPEMINTRQLSAKIAGKLDEDSEEEYFPDIDSDEEEKVKKTVKVSSPPPTAASSARTGYDPTARNPRYCGAEKECMWELLQLKNNFHPSVRVFAAALLDGTPIDYSGDPFEDFTLIHFLDRFLQKKPKRVAEENAQGAAKARSLAVNSEEYRNLDEGDIPEDEKCFYEFAQVRSERRRKKEGGDLGQQQQDEDEDDDVGSVGDEEFDAYLDRHEGDLDVDLKDLDDLGSGDDETEDFSEEELQFSASDDDDDDEVEEFEDSDDDAPSEMDDDDDDIPSEMGDDDGMQFMEVEEDDEDVDDEEDERGEFSFLPDEESVGQKKQRQWEEKRLQWTSGNQRDRGRSRSDQGVRGRREDRCGFRGRGGGRGDPSGFRGRGGGRGDRSGFRGRRGGRGDRSGFRGRGGGVRGGFRGRDRGDGSGFRGRGQGDRSGFRGRGGGGRGGFRGRGRDGGRGDGWKRGKRGSRV